jgi:ABC transporter DrrB family efflux protein
MAATVLAPAPGAAARPDRENPLTRFVKDTSVLTWRSIARIRNELATLSDVTIQPIMFVLMFTYVFGSAINVGPGGAKAYHEYLIAGMFGMTVVGTMQGTAVALTTDMETGLIDRFRSLPISRAAVLAGRALADLATNLLGLAILTATGLLIGWRVHTNAWHILVAVGLVVLFSFAVTWAGVCLGMVFKSAEAAQQLGFLVFIPFTFVSNAFVPAEGMPAALRIFAQWNPISAIAAACRNQFGNPNPAASSGVWPMVHPELMVLFWSIALLAVFAPLAVHLYQRKTKA